MKAPTTSERSERLRELLKNARKGNDFAFFINKTEVCEGGFLLALGLSASSPPRMWRTLKAAIIEGREAVDREFTAAPRWGVMYQHAQDYQRKVINTECDDDPEHEIKVLPYIYASQFYQEYEHHFTSLTISGEVTTADIASKRTFVRALAELIGVYISRLNYRTIQ